MRSARYAWAEPPCRPGCRSFFSVVGNSPRAMISIERFRLRADKGNEHIRGIVRKHRCQDAARSIRPALALLRPSHRPGPLNSPRYGLGSAIFAAFENDELRSAAFNSCANIWPIRPNRTR